jgi:hypothetical protein
LSPNTFYPTCSPQPVNAKKSSSKSNTDIQYQKPKPAKEGQVKSWCAHWGLLLIAEVLAQLQQFQDSL